MSKKFVIISLIITAIIGSLVTFYASNLFFSDVSNFGAGFMSSVSIKDQILEKSYAETTYLSLSL